MVFTLGLILFMFYNYSAIGFGGLMLFGAFVFLGIFGYTTLMDRKTYAFYLELFRALAGIIFIGITGDWFGIDAHWGYGSILIGLYFVITAVGGYYFTFIERRDVHQEIAF